MTVIARLGSGVRTFASDITHGFFEIAHNSFAMLGLVLAFAIITLTARPELREESETALISWLKSRQPVVVVAMADIAIPAEPDAVDRATAANPHDLPKQQAAVAYWLSKKYDVAPEPVAALVAEAYDVGAKVKIDPTLILAIMAIESSFNPFAQSPVGAQGLMQVMTTVHNDKYQGFGGKFAAFDPVTNLRVGVKVLQECITRAGSVEGGLRQYVGATSDATEGGYTAKVMAEYGRIRAVAGGQTIPTFTPPTGQLANAAPTAPRMQAQPVMAPTADLGTAQILGTAQPAAEDKVPAVANL
jgi:hypothetical protein